MFEGFEATGFAAIGEPPEDRVAWAASSDLTVDWLIRVYTATHELISRDTDDPPATPYYGTLQDAFALDRSVVGTTRLGESVTIGLGEVTLSNLDGQYDYLARDATPLGQEIVISMGDRRAPLARWHTVLVGYTVGMQLDRDKVRFSLRDAGHRLDTAASPSLYAGTGGVEGGEDLKGKRKPRVFGHVSNFAAPLVIAPALAYQINDGPIAAVTAAYVRGAALTFAADYPDVVAMNAASLSVGTFATCLVAGWARIAVASGSETGQVTFDVRGDAADGVFVDTTAQVVRRLLVTAAKLADPDDLVVTSFDKLDAVQPAAIGYAIPVGDEQTVRDAVGRLMAAIGGWCGFNRRGRCEVRRFEVPAGIPVGAYDVTTIEDVQRVPLPSDITPPPWRVKVGWGRVWTLQTSDLAGSVAEARRAYLAAAVRFASAEDADTRLIYPPGNELSVEAFFRDEAAALAEAERRRALFGTSRELYSVKLAQRLYVHELGQVVQIRFDRLGLEDGRLCTIVRVAESHTDGTSGDGVELTVFT